jgi:hypothetical protein
MINIPLGFASVENGLNITSLNMAVTLSDITSFCFALHW